MPDLVNLGGKSVIVAEASSRIGAITARRLPTAAWKPGTLARYRPRDDFAVSHNGCGPSSSATAGDRGARAAT
jgi:hypothetical protein